MDVSKGGFPRSSSSRVTIDAGPRAAQILRAIRLYRRRARRLRLVRARSRSGLGPGTGRERPADGAHRLVGAAGLDGGYRQRQRLSAARPADRDVRARGGDRRRRDGGRLPRARHPARPPRRAEAPAARAVGRPRGRPAVLPGRAGRRAARSREHRAGLHHRPRQRTSTTSPSSTSRGRRSASGSSGTARCR